VKISEFIETLYQNYEVVVGNKQMLLTTSQLRREHALTYWASLIGAAALTSAAKMLNSEDMQDGLVIRETMNFVLTLLKHSLKQSDNFVGLFS
jgi:predicted nucleic acid-binding protein